jgi:hypothetical protein
MVMVMAMMTAMMMMAMGRPVGAAGSSPPRPA